MANQLRILDWNSNGLLQHQQEMQAVLDIEKIDVLMYSETHFTKESYTNFTGFKVYHTFLPDNTAREGSAIIIKDSISHYQETGYQTVEIQATSVNIKTKPYEVMITALYCLPRYAKRMNSI